MSFLKVEHLFKRYRQTNAVVDVSFEVDAGTMLGLVGPNGAGKSTLLRMLAAILRPDRGSIEIDGLNVLKNPCQVRKRIGYVPDVFGLYDDTKVWEYLDLFARCYELPGRARQAAIAELLKLVDLFDFRFAYCRSLSRGMQQRLLIARALLPDPDLLLLDEPLAGLDPQTRLEMLEVFRELGSLGKTVLVSSYAIADLVDVCDRVGIMASGQVTALGTVPELIRHLDPMDRVRLVVLEDYERARAALTVMPGVEGLEERADGLTFICHGGRAAQAEVLRQLIGAGVKVAQFGPVARALEELTSTAPRTEPSAEQMQP